MNVERVIGEITGEPSKGTVVFFAGLHGNEPAGVFALIQVVDELRASKRTVRGTFLALAGNLASLAKAERYAEFDLNRMWTPQRMANFETLDERSPDFVSQKALYDEIWRVLDGKPAPYYFVDLHTTSSETPPFLTINDSLINRTFTQVLPAANILGFEEYLEGPLLNYINALGYVGFGFEGGQHDSVAAIENHRALIYLVLDRASLIELTDSERAQHMDCLRKYGQPSERLKPLHGFYEIVHRHAVAAGETFRMDAGFTNFQSIKKGERLAVHGGRAVFAPRSGQIFMPLYQDQGDDGFFIVRPIPSFFLQLSARLRRWHVARGLRILPGVSWHDEEEGALSVDPKVARFLAKEFFHLFGYRSREVRGIGGKTMITMRNRERVSRYADYQGCDWLSASR